MKDLILRRNKTEPDSIKNMIYKLAANSFYGKTVQGLDPKRVINLPRSLEIASVSRDVMKESSVFNPFIAGYITGFVRGLVAEYLLHFQRQGIAVVNVTTDGFMIDSRLNDAELKGVGILSGLLSDVRKYYLGDDIILELKHQGKGVLAIKTRLYMITEKLENQSKDERLVAKGGIQIPKGLRNDAVIARLFKYYLDAFPNMTQPQKSLSNVSDYFYQDIEDLIEIEREVSVNMDYDFKRMPCNLDTVGCNHGCLYCYAPSTIKRKKERYCEIEPTNNTIENIKNSAKNYRDQDVLLCFFTDTYNSLDMEMQLTRQAITILRDNGVIPVILTKAGMKSTRDFDLLDSNSKYGATLTFIKPEDSLRWEPFAALPEERFQALKEAKSKGIKTWVSLEPVIDPEQSIECIHKTHEFVDHYKVGKWNYDKRASEINWKKFLNDAVSVLKHYKKDFYIKTDLRGFKK